MFSMSMWPGFPQKKDSIKQLIQEHSPDIVLLTEPKVYTKVSIKIDGYQVFPAVRKKAMERVSCSCQT